MKNLSKILLFQGAVVLLAVSLLLAACNVPTPTAPPVAATSTPTTDPTLPPPPPTGTPTVVPTVPPTPVPIPTDTATPPPAPVIPAIFRMLDANNGWMVSDKGRVLHTTTGLSGWQDITPSQAPVPPPDAVFIALPTAFFLDANHAWLAFIDQVSNEIMLLRTSDGGSTWLAGGNLPPGEDLGGSFGPISFYFIDNQKGWLWTQVHPGMMHVYAALYQTSDGGQNWQIVFDPRPSADVPNISLHGSFSLSFGSNLFTFVDAKNGFVGTGIFQVTKDGGKTWNNVNLIKPAGLPVVNNPYPYVAPPVFANAKDGVVPVYIFASDKVYNPPGDSFSDLPGASYLSWTHDGGKTWKAYPMPARIGSIALLDSKTAWFLGKSDPSPTIPSSLFLTLDGGLTWKSMSSNSPLPLGSQLQFIDPSTGFAFGPEYGEITLFGHFDSRVGNGIPGYLYQSPGWSQLNITVK